MPTKKLIGLALAGAALLWIGASVAQADEDDSEGYPSTQSPTQGVDAGEATLETQRDSFMDAANGDDRPNGANGTETEFFDPDSRFVEGPVGGLLKDGPLK
ncbi:hypothetical protein GCM10023321_52880 [Pseudonocardia eucalypti]|uniref:Uncharacterized protein n=1 Tax=Pseudonocardia eucalypti TaxID=648755 RepID=A0ABP9QMQ6_9PSEU|nr:hypothetical protein [Pseudonocardia eucalypti]